MKIERVLGTINNEGWSTEVQGEKMELLNNMSD